MLDPQLAAMVAQAQAAGMPDLCDLPPPAARGLYRQILAAADVPPADVITADRTVPRPGAGTGTIPVRLYRPKAQAGTQALIVYYHGGGFVLGDLDGYDNVCRQLCEDTQALVLSVDYRLAPEHPFPAAVDDAWTALLWAAEHAASLGADPQRMAVCGDSAGATLAAVVTLMAREVGGPAIAYQALVYPAIAGGVEGAYPSRIEHANGPTLTARTAAYFNRHYFGPSGRAPDFRGAPILASDLSGLPPTLVMVASHDVLRDEILAYAQRLIEAGNETIVVEYRGLAHGFISMGGALRAARLAQLQLAHALQSALRTS